MPPPQQMVKLPLDTGWIVMGTNCLILLHRCTQNRDLSMNNQDCIAVLLFDRAFGMFEFEDVRKLAAELCGRLHPEVLLLVIEYQLKHAAECRDILQMKACLFAICSSIAARDGESAMHPIMPRIRRILEMILSWPSLDDDELSKAQHGCIDSLALMICAELQSPGPSKDFPSDREGIAGEGNSSVGAREGDSVSSTLTRVIQSLTCKEEKHGFSSTLDEEATYHDQHSVPSSSIQFKLCMANVLISACQKVPCSKKDIFSSRFLPPLMRSIQGITCSDVRAACLQIFFSAVYHLKSSVLPFTAELLSLSVKALKKGSEKEKLAAVKLMASLMASEDEILNSISGGLLEAKSVLEKAASSSNEDSSELRLLSKKLMATFSSPLRVYI